jgi:hypothetical protein
MYRRLRIPEPEKEQRAHRQIKRMADARQREMKLVCFYFEIFHCERNFFKIVFGKLYNSL